MSVKYKARDADRVAVTFRIDRGLHERLTSLAAEQGISVNRYVNELLDAKAEIPNLTNRKIRRLADIAAEAAKAAILERLA